MIGSDTGRAERLGRALDEIAVAMPPSSTVTIRIGSGFDALKVTGSVEGEEEIEERAGSWSRVSSGGGEALWRMRERLWDQWYQKRHRDREAA